MRPTSPERIRYRLELKQRIAEAMQRPGVKVKRTREQILADRAAALAEEQRWAELTEEQCEEERERLRAKWSGKTTQVH